MINPTVTKLRNKVAELEMKLQQKQDVENHFLGNYNQLCAEIDQMEQINTELQAKLSQVENANEILSDELLKAKSLNEMLKSEMKAYNNTLISVNQEYKAEKESKDNIIKIFKTGMEQQTARFKWFFLIGLIFGTIAGLTLSLCF